jgi:hypothetical protein
MGKGSRTAMSCAFLGGGLAGGPSACPVSSRSTGPCEGTRGRRDRLRRSRGIHRRSPSRSPVNTGHRAGSAWSTIRKIALKPVRPGRLKSSSARTSFTPGPSPLPSQGCLTRGGNAPSPSSSGTAAGPSSRRIIARSCGRSGRMWIQTWREEKRERSGF